MTRSTLTRERIELIANFHRAMTLPPSHAEIEELARMALAAMDSEPAAPVAEIVSIYGDPEAFGEREIRPLVGIQQMPYGTKLYLHAQPAPAVPGKWIPVSEQMPEDRTQVILWDAEIGEVTSGHYSHKTHTFYHCGDAIENEITHWMPPPASPQEVK